MTVTVGTATGLPGVARGGAAASGRAVVAVRRETYDERSRSERLRAAVEGDRLGRVQPHHRPGDVRGQP